MMELTLIQGKKEVDIAIPIEITFGRLHQLLQELFMAQQAILSENFQLICKDKILFGEWSDPIASFGVGNGDRIEIQDLTFQTVND